MKAMVIGLDGATFTILTPLMQAGYMPNLEKALARGACGELLSTIPPVTALAWPCFMTGKNPGKHGLTGWQGRLNARLERPWLSGRQVRGAKLWHLANQAGMKTCVVNVPVTYPPEALNGAMITGMLTPGLKAEFTYPPELKTTLLDAVPDYQIDVDVQHSQPNTSNLEAIRRFLDKALAVTHTRGKAIHWLLDREQPDLAVLVFELPDRLQHILWRYIEHLPLPAQGLDGATVIRDKLLACYQALDEEIGRLVDRLPPKAYLGFLSDHGFGPWDTNVHLSDWLAQQGWSTYDRGRIGRWEVLRRVGSRFKRQIPSALKRRTLKTFSLLRTLDWSQTQAYAGLPTEDGVFINLRGREPFGIVEQADYEPLRADIIEALREWRDPRNDQPIIKAIYRREELYTGPFVAHAPDILFELQRSYRVSDLTGRGALFSDVSQEPWGFHEQEGIWAMSGPGIEPGLKVDGAHIMDVMPTLLYSLGLPVPDDVDGRVLLEIYSPAWQADHPLHSQHAPEADTDAQASHPFSAEEEALIKERLKGLGYLE